MLQLSALSSKIVAHRASLITTNLDAVGKTKTMSKEDKKNVAAQR